MPKRTHLPLLLTAILSLGAVACSPTDSNKGTAEDGSAKTVVDPANNGNNPDASGQDTLGSPDASQDDGTGQNSDADVDSSSDSGDTSSNSSSSDTNAETTGTDMNGSATGGNDKTSTDSSGSGNVVNEEGGVGNPMTDSIFREPSGNNTADEKVDPQDDLSTDASAPDSNDTDTSNTTTGN
ncbi:hypothetical protein [Deinococcus yavapaiensis]|uniref:Uncharacterized protein n=1 Tax=Deinococcus yavapaiensis KR-236 TaxID=694435 RepID=A0A318S7P5_9DEIO|nr:hypothetical protein [Deinococcus yavapaiensis]PYE51200.1 hypothetical protein DES52_115132 [Deinococcus yavapaiensis KR-236]